MDKPASEGSVDESFVQVDPDDAQLLELQNRIEKLKSPAQGSPVFARGIALATSMGFVLAGCLVAGFFLGHFLSLKTGYRVFEVFGLLTGLAIAIVSLAKMIRPFWSSPR